MPARTIRHWPDPLLKRKSRPVKKIEKSEIQLAQDLCDTMKAALGAGLAASQVGDDREMVVIAGDYSSPETLPKDPLLQDQIVLVNPSIEFLGEDKFEWEEACLSVPDYSDVVVRFSNIQLSYLDLEGNLHKKNLTPPFSGIVQHEVDHLSGILYLDRLSSSRKRKARDTLLARKRKKARLLKKKAQAEKSQKDVEVRNGFRPPGAKSNSKRKKIKKSFGKSKRRKN